MIEKTHKDCTQCGTHRAITEYSIVTVKGRKYRASQCKPCAAKKANEKYHRLTEEQKKEIVVSRRKYNRSYKLMSLYGLTDEAYERMFIDQDGKCYLCHRDFEDTQAYIDHDHDTGKVRKLLCRNCNTTLGIVNEDINRLMEMIIYIEDHK